MFHLLFCCFWPSYNPSGTGRVISAPQIKVNAPLEDDAIKAYMDTWEYKESLEERVNSLCYYRSLIGQKKMPWVNPIKNNGIIMKDEEAKEVSARVKQSLMDEDKKLLKSKGIDGLPKPVQMLQEVEKTSEFFINFINFVCFWNPCCWRTINHKNQVFEIQSAGGVVCKREWSVFYRDGRLPGKRTEFVMAIRQ